MSAFKARVTNQGGEKTEVPPAGAHPAVLVAIIDLGTHEDEYNGKATFLRKCLYVFELTAEKMTGFKDRNHVVTKDFTIGGNGEIVLGPKNGLRKMLEGWRGSQYPEGQEIDIAGPLGKPCLVTIKHGKSGKGNDYAKIEAVAPVPKGLAVPPATHAPFAWEIGNTGEPPAEDWIPYLYGTPVVDVIKGSHEFLKKPIPKRNGGATEPEEEPVGAGANIPF